MKPSYFKKKSQSLEFQKSNTFLYPVVFHSVMGEIQYVCILTIVAILWMWFFVWACTKATIQYVDKVYIHNTME